MIIYSLLMLEMWTNGCLKRAFSKIGSKIGHNSARQEVFRCRLNWCDWEKCVWACVCPSRAWGLWSWPHHAIIQAQSIIPVQAAINLTTFHLEAHALFHSQPHFLLPFSTPALWLHCLPECLWWRSFRPTFTTSFILSLPIRFFLLLLPHVSSSKFKWFSFVKRKSYPNQHGSVEKCGLMDSLCVSTEFKSCLTQ